MKGININDLTIGQAKELLSTFRGTDLSSEAVSVQTEIPFEVGKSYYFRTVTHIELGEVESICGVFVTLKNASWIAEAGRHYDLLKTGKFDDYSEIEPYTFGSIVNTSSLINAAPWPHKLPRKQK